MEDNICPKPTCGKPESTHRWKAGKRLSICGNGHSWNQEEVAAQKAKAEAAQQQESKIETHYREIMKQFGGNPFV